MMTLPLVRSGVMAINAVQFQEGLSMVEFLAQFGTETKCYRTLCRAR